MKISRLDKIIENNVGFSSYSNKDAQKIAILQDISETLAMIYDKMCDMKSVSMASVPVSKIAQIVPFNELKDAKYIEFDEYEGYEIKFDRYEAQETIDIRNNEKRTETFAIIIAFNEEMRLSEKKYGKTWRCWTTKPNETDRSAVKWEK